MQVRCPHCHSPLEILNDDVELLPSYAWHVFNAAGTCQPVGRLRPNPKGLFDMQGNAYEWCFDRYLREPEFVPVDPSGPTEATASGASRRQLQLAAAPNEHGRTQLRFGNRRRTHHWFPSGPHRAT